MTSRSSHRYAPLSTTRPLADIPYESDDEVDLKRRAIQPDHPPVDLHRAPPQSSAPAPPIGVAVSSAVLVVAGVCLLVLVTGGVGVKAAVAVRALCGVVGGFLLLSGAYTLYAFAYHASMRLESGGYVFPSYSR